MLLGVGGELGGRDASEAAATVARSAYYSVPGDDPGAWLVGAISEAHKAVKERAVSTGFTGMATTIVMAAVQGGRLYMAHVGDSRAYLLRNGRLDALTRDHSWVNAQAGMFGSEREMRESTMRNVITRSLGSASNNTPDVAAPMALMTGDRVMLCTDGLHGVVPREEIEARVLAAISPAERKAN